MGVQDSALSAVACLGLTRAFSFTINSANLMLGLRAIHHKRILYGVYMGIVVTIAMLLGLIVLRPTPWRDGRHERQSLRLVTFTAASLAILGAWNVLWYGLRHLDAFWGWAAIVSGLAMLLAAVVIMMERGNPLSEMKSWLVVMRSGVVVVLALSFLLYAVTIIQLNLNLPIIGR